MIAVQHITSYKSIGTLEYLKGTIFCRYTNVYNFCGLAQKHNFVRANKVY